MFRITNAPCARRSPCAHLIPRRLGVGLAVAAIGAASALLALPRHADACGGTPPPPPSHCGKGYAFGKVSPGTIAVPAGTGFTIVITTWHALALIDANPQMPVCPPPPYNVFMTITVGNCLPGGPGVGPINVGPIPILKGAQTVLVPVNIPAGPPRNCVISIQSTVVFTDGTSIGPLQGDAQICIVDELPGQPGVPRLDMQPLTPTVVGTHASDAASVTYRVTNNDPVETWNGVVTGDFHNTAKQPPESPAGPVREAFAFADPGPGDNWPIAIGPSPCIPLPPDPLLETSSQVVSDPISLAPGESQDISVVVRPWGMCADGSCGESIAVATGTFTDGTDGLACAGALYHVDNAEPPQYACPDSGAAVQFDPGSDPFIVHVLLSPAPSKNQPIDQALIPLATFPAETTVESGAQQMGPWTGRFNETVLPFDPIPVDSFFDILYQLQYTPPPSAPPVDIEITQMSLAPGAPTGYTDVAPMALARLTVTDMDGDVSVASLLHQFSGYADLDDGTTVPIQIASLDFSPTGAGVTVHLQGQAIPNGSKRARERANANDDTRAGLPPPAIIALHLMTDTRGYAFAPPQCIADFDGDGATTVFDFAVLATNFGSSVPPNTGGDLDGNGFVDIFDFGMFATDFGCPN